MATAAIFSLRERKILTDAVSSGFSDRMHPRPRAFVEGNSDRSA
jgi:hypothetical protein